MLRVRTGREADVPAIARVVEAAFAPFVARTGVRPEPLSSDWATLVSALGVTVALVDDRVAGVLVAWPRPASVLVETLAVDPDQQGRGAGGALLDVAERLAIETGANAVTLSTNALMHETRAYYGRRGWVEVGRGIVHGYDRVHLEKRL